MSSDSNELFPNSPRVVYEHAPLLSVVCQLRFPSLLRIESEPPVDFQERIRDNFPQYERGQAGLPAGVTLPPDVMRLIGQKLGGSGYHFSKENGSARVTLTPDFLALETSRYTEWKNFRADLEGPLRALVDVYRPSFFSRIGLRYQNAIDRAVIGLSDTP